VGGEKLYRIGEKNHGNVAKSREVSGEMITTKVVFNFISIFLKQERK